MEKSGPRCSQISEWEWLKTAIPEEIICANQGFLLSKSVLIGFYYTFTHWQVQLMPFYHFLSQVLCSQLPPFFLTVSLHIHMISISKVINRTANHMWTQESENYWAVLGSNSDSGLFYTYNKISFAILFMLPKQCAVITNPYD